jgi:hypothetical protein
MNTDPLITGVKFQTQEENPITAGTWNTRTPASLIITLAMQITAEKTPAVTFPLISEIKNSAEKTHAKTWTTGETLMITIETQRKTGVLRAQAFEKMTLMISAALAMIILEETLTLKIPALLHPNLLKTHIGPLLLSSATLLLIFVLLLGHLGDLNSTGRVHI